MPRTMFQTCQKIIETAKLKGFQNEIHYEDLKKIIRFVAGSHPLTMQRYKKELLNAGFISTENGLTFKLHEVDPGFI